MPPQELPRLATYKVLASYVNNQARQLAAVGGDTRALERRELGDAAKLLPVGLVLRTRNPPAPPWPPPGCSVGQRLARCTSDTRAPAA
ncbi:hypothetical protein GCM10010270_28280 [Streptomyces violaceus]|nr:hypothetical protein GCM10010270_28280 [Streptomyces janthinus]